MPCDLEIVKRAKKLGCPAFKPGNRIDVDELRKWIAENAEKLKAAGETLSLKDQKLNEEIRKLKLSNDEKERLVVSKEKTAELVARIIQKQREVLEQKLENEYPSTVYGLEIPQIRVHGRRLNDEILKAWQTFHTEWKSI